jgi:hypothetical protein
MTIGGSWLKASALVLVLVLLTGNLATGRRADKLHCA